MKASIITILLGVLMVSSYATVAALDQQTAATDSYVAALQGGLNSLQQNVARLQQIQTSLNTVWQQQMNNALLVGDTAFVSALNVAKAQLDQLFATTSGNATSILTPLDSWIKLTRSTYLTKTASYQLQRDILMASFNSSIAAGPGMARSCAQHYYAQFEGIEYNFLITTGAAYNTAAGTLATQSAAVALLLNMGETDALRQLNGFNPATTLVKDSTDNWNTIYNRITLATNTAITNLRTAVQSLMTTVDASIVVPATLLTSVNQVRSAYALCTRMG